MGFYCNRRERVATTLRNRSQPFTVLPKLIRKTVENQQGVSQARKTPTIRAAFFSGEPSCGRLSACNSLGVEQCKTVARFRQRVPHCHSRDLPRNNSERG